MDCFSQKEQEGLRSFLKEALYEDVGSGDVTCSALFQDSFIVSASLLSKNNGILAGIEPFLEVFRILDPFCVTNDFPEDGSRLTKNMKIGMIQGKVSALLTGERVALNILSHLSGIATLTSRFVESAGGDFQILDTRKTLPGMRTLEKYAVRIGGGYNHRKGLDSMIMIKDNHISSWISVYGGSRIEAIPILIKNANAKKGSLKLEVEVESLEEAFAAWNAGADIIMFDNSSPEMIKEFLARIGTKHPPVIEASGGISLATVPSFRGSGVNWVSVGALTHSAPAFDFSLEIIPSSSSLLE